MKLGLTLATIFFLHGISTQAQEIQSSKVKKWKYSQYDFGIGIDNDHYYRMSLSRMMAFAEDPNKLQRDLQNMDEEIATKTAGMALYFNRSYMPFSKADNKYREDRELRVGIGCHAPKESMITYKNEALDTSIVYCNMHGEFTLEAAYMERGTFGKRDKFVWYLGCGMNASATFSNEMLVIQGGYFEDGAHPSSQPSYEENTQRFLAKPVAYTRIYLPYGIHRKVGDHWSVGFDAKRGIGFQTILGGGTSYIRKTGTFVLGAKYRF